MMINVVLGLLVKVFYYSDESGAFRIGRYDVFMKRLVVLSKVKGKRCYYLLFRYLVESFLFFY